MVRERQQATFSHHPSTPTVAPSSPNILTTWIPRVGRRSFDMFNWTARQDQLLLSIQWLIVFWYHEGWLTHFSCPNGQQTMVESIPHGRAQRPVLQAVHSWENCFNLMKLSFLICSQNEKTCFSGAVRTLVIMGMRVPASRTYSAACEIQCEEQGLLIQSYFCL